MAATAPSVAAQDQRLLEIVAGLAGELRHQVSPAVALDTRLEQDLGFDSLSRMELMLRVERSFGVSLPEQALTSAETPRELLAYLQRGAPAPAPTALRPLTQNNGTWPVEAGTLTEVLDWHASEHPNKLHVHLYAEQDSVLDISYLDLQQGARRVAAGLAGRGLDPGRSVAIMLPTGRDYLFSFFGILIAGGVPVPIYPPARLSQIEDHLRRHAGILENSEACWLITVPEAKPLALLLRAHCARLRGTLTVAELTSEPRNVERPTLRPSDLALLQYTSGSTGNPKGVMLTHAHLLANIRAMGEAIEVSGKDVFVSWLPLYHDMGLIGTWLGALYFGLPLALMSPLAFLARPARWLQTVHRHRGTLSAAPNFAYELCARKLADEDLAGLDLSCWRIAFNGAEPVSAATVEAFAARLAGAGFRREAMTPVYGLAESAVGLTFPPPGRGPLIDVIQREPLVRGGKAVPAGSSEVPLLKLVSCGRPLAGYEIRVVDAGGEEVGDRVEGRLEFKGPSATGGYFRNPEQTRKLVSGDWLDSGDFAYVAGGEVYITGRVKDIIIRGGRNLYPYDLEQAIGAIPGIRKGCVAVFGSADPASGTERVVVLAETALTDPSARERLVRQINVAALDVIGVTADDVVLAPPHTVLKTSSGKIRRAASREYYERRGSHVRPAPVWLQFARVGAGALGHELRRKARGIRATLYAAYAWTVMALIGGSLWLLVASLQRPALARRACHYAAVLVSALTGIRVKIAGRDRIPSTRHILVVNHASYIDAILLAVALPPAHRYVYVVKSEFARNWAARRFFDGLEAAFVERSDARQGIEDLGRVEQAIRDGASPVFFPEGTFDRRPGLREFRLGAFSLAARTGVPVLPVGIRGARSILRDVSWFPRRGTVDVTTGAPLLPSGEDWNAAVELRDRARVEILRLSGEPQTPR